MFYDPKGIGKCFVYAASSVRLRTFTVESLFSLSFLSIPRWFPLAFLAFPFYPIFFYIFSTSYSLHVFTCLRVPLPPYFLSLYLTLWFSFTLSVSSMLSS